MNFYNTYKRLNLFDNKVLSAFYVAFRRYENKNNIRLTSPDEFKDIQRNVIATTADVSFAEINQLISRIQDLQAYDGKKRDARQRHSKFIFTTQFQKLFKESVK